MTISLYLLIALAFLGAWDTIYYHEWRAKLPALGKMARSELRLHAWRDFVYAILFAMLPWFAWRGAYAGILVLLFLIEIVLTLWDFIVEDWIRKPIGGVYPGERVMHAIMGIVYGALLACIVPTIRMWWRQSSDLSVSLPLIPSSLRWLMLAMAVGVALSGARDLCAAAGLRGSSWPWKPG